MGRCQVLALAAGQSAATGLAGGVLGAAAYAGLLPVLANYRFGTGTWFAADLWIGVPRLLAVLAAVALLTVASTVSALRQVAVSPLAVARQQDPRSTRRARAVVLVVILAGCLIAQQTGRLGQAWLFGLIILVFLAFGIIGPWVVDRLGRLLCRLARGPVLLLAGRRLADDPRATWRTISSLALAGFVPGFFSIAQLGALNQNGGSHQVAVAVPATSATALSQQAEQRLHAACRPRAS